MSKAYKQQLIAQHNRRYEAEQKKWKSYDKLKSMLKKAWRVTT